MKFFITDFDPREWGQIIEVEAMQVGAHTARGWMVLGTVERLVDTYATRWDQAANMNVSMARREDVYILGLPPDADDLRRMSATAREEAETAQREISDLKNRLKYAQDEARRATAALQLGKDMKDVP